MSFMCPGQEGNQLFLKQGFIKIAKCKAWSEGEKQELKMTSSFPVVHSLFTSLLQAQTQVEQSFSNSY